MDHLSAKTLFVGQIHILLKDKIVKFDLNSMRWSVMDFCPVCLYQKYENYPAHDILFRLKISSAI